MKKAGSGSATLILRRLFKLVFRSLKGFLFAYTAWYLFNNEMNVTAIGTSGAVFLVETRDIQGPGHSAQAVVNLGVTQKVHLGHTDYSEV